MKYCKNCALKFSTFWNGCNIQKLCKVHDVFQGSYFHFELWHHQNESALLRIVDAFEIKNNVNDTNLNILNQNIDRNLNKINKNFN